MTHIDPRMLRSHVQRMYDESGHIWHATRSKKYHESGTLNWPVVQKYLNALTSRDSVLDVGCGDGRLLSGLNHDIPYTGIDFSQTLLENARHDYPGANFIMGDITQEETWQGIGRFTTIISIAVLHHIPERDQQLFALQQMKEHSMPGGMLILSVWNLWQERFLQYHLDSAHLKEVNERWVEIPFHTTWKRFCFQMDIPYLMKLLSDSGWSVDEIFYADRAGNKSDIQTGQNLVAVAHLPC